MAKVIQLSILAKLVAGMQDAGIRSPASKTPNPAPLVGIPAPVVAAAPTLAPNPVGFIDPSVIMQQQGLRKFF
jgi:hypothetical protein